ncbi:glycine betaine ABC transporter substrate-binding protein [Roseibium sp. RKSG952]|uniref:glycine betaine ABC transporter substrate-binding protein n=1 Tax=Roseibium sp. RKSG952 TaxID=2529384 RepID=UPI0012BB54B4|nr:glycine betaine ABC transporter substrate-binding protein [Roseibium sp. RKSG952]MTH96988.1 ABC transporter substrate-binding protein [Roseibium sp. RKSG952]
MRGLFKIAFTGFVLFSPVALAEDCGLVTIAEMPWDTAGTMAQIDAIILGKGYGCRTDLIYGNSVPTFESMIDRGMPDIAPEIWQNAYRSELQAALKDGSVVVAGHILKDGAIEGFWIPTFLAKEHNLKTLDDVLAHPELFPGAEDKTKGAFFQCPPGWDCQITSDNLLRAWHYREKGFVEVPTGSPAGLTGSLAKAMEERQGWFGYNWAPTASMARYDLTRIDFDVPFNKEEWDTCTTVPNCPDPKKNAFEKQAVYTIVTGAFAKRPGPVMGYLKLRGWDTKTAEDLLEWMDQNEADHEDGAYYFLQNYEHVWSQWVSPEVVEKVKAAL